MKPSLDRTAVLSKDLTEQYEGSQYIVMIPDANIVLAADEVLVSKEEIGVREGTRIIARFAPTLAWVCIERSCVDVVRREDQLRRQVENVKAEKELMREIAPEAMAAAEEKEKAAEIVREVFSQGGKGGYGQYL